MPDTKQGLGGGKNKTGQLVGANHRKSWLLNCLDLNLNSVISNAKVKMDVQKDESEQQYKMKWGGEDNLSLKLATCHMFFPALTYNACFPSLRRNYSEDLCIFDVGSSQYSTSSACKFLAEKCLNNNQFHFVHTGSCQEGPQLEWGLERLRLALNSTKRVSCGYDTCYDWEKCSGKLLLEKHTRNTLT